MIDYLDALRLTNDIVAASFNGLWFTLGTGFGLLLGEIIHRLEK